LGTLDSNVYMIPHHETRSCLFDMNVFVDRVIYSSVKPLICSECKSRLEKKSLPDNFVKNIEKELKRIKRPVYYRLESQIKKRPFFYLAITAIFAILLHITATLIYDYFKGDFSNNTKPEKIVNEK